MKETQLDTINKVESKLANIKADLKGSRRGWFCLLTL